MTGSAYAGATPEVVERLLAPLLALLLDNARRYAVRAISVECGAAPNGQVRVDVADDGLGVPARHAEAVFEAGRRLRPDDGHEGAGLGLPLARRLARAAGGELALLPTPGTGARCA